MVTASKSAGGSAVLKSRRGGNTKKGEKTRGKQCELILLNSSYCAACSGSGSTGQFEAVWKMEEDVMSLCARCDLFDFDPACKTLTNILTEAYPSPDGGNDICSSQEAGVDGKRRELPFGKAIKSTLRV
ncbi:hypothetical protein PAMP_003448 [Pampus punctatissimus]